MSMDFSIFAMLSSTMMYDWLCSVEGPVISHRREGNQFNMTPSELVSRRHACRRRIFPILHHDEESDIPDHRGRSFRQPAARIPDYPSNALSDGGMRCPRKHHIGQ